MVVTVSKLTGEINTIELQGKNILSDPCNIMVNDTTISTNAAVFESRLLDEHPRVVLLVKKQLGNRSIEYTYTIDSLCFLFEVEINDSTNIGTDVSVCYTLPLNKGYGRLSHKAPGISESASNLSEYVYVYRKNIFVPMLTIYDPIENYGLSIIAPMEIPKPTLSFSITEEKLMVLYDHLRFTDGGTTKTAICIVPHEGDWRPGLQFLLERYPEYFYPVVENTQRGEGWYAQGNTQINETKIEDIASRNAKWMEFHYYFPFIGLYTPKFPNWGLTSNSDAISLLNWEKGIGAKRNSYNDMKNLISLWHKYAIQVYLYFQVFEAWHQYARKYFPEDIARDEKGNPLPSWKFTNLMNPNPESKWGKYIVDQVKKLIRKYPEIDGIFYDRMDYWNYDFAHDDGITTVNNKPTYMLSFALEKINRKVFDIVHKEGKAIWGNGPTSIEVCKNLDGIMAEGNLRNLYKTQYLGLVRPIVYLPYDRIPEETESKLKNALVCGAFPSITYGGTECQKLDKKYVPLFDLIKSREWVLSSNPIVMPEGLRGNIFQTPDGDYIATVINPEKSQLVPHPFEYEVPVTINVPDANDIKHVYLLSGDWQGVNSLDFEKQGKMIEINLPYHLTSSVLYLSKTRKYDLTRISSPILIKNRTEKLLFKLSGVSKDDPSTIEINTAWFNQRSTVTSNMVEFRTRIPENIEGEIDINLTCNGTNHTFTSWVLDQISITQVDNIFIHDRDGENILFYCVNNLKKKNSFELRGKFVLGTGKIEIPQRITLQPLESRMINLFIESKTDGEIQLTANIEDKPTKKTFVIKAGLSFSKSDLFHDDFKNGMKKWTINRGQWKASNDIANGSGLSHFAFIRNKEWQDYIFEVKTRCKGSDSPGVDWLKSYIFFRLQDNKNFYRYGIHGGYETISLYKCVNGKWSELAKIPFSAQKGRWYTLKVEVKGNKFIGYLDGKMMIKATDDTFSSGGIGLGVLEDWIVTDYKNIIVKKS